MAVAGRVAIVPKGDYDKNATYKRLDCVKYYNVMYVAKKDVPKGIELTNEEYWMKGIEGNGSGGAGIDDSQVSTLTTYSSSKITDLTDEINNSLEEKASEINDNVDTKLEDKLDKKDGDISETVAGAADIPEIRTIPTVGDKFKAIFGKTIKYFQDLKTIAFTGNYEDLLNKPTIPTVTNNLLATNPGTALDAVQGKAISDVLGSTDISGIGDGTITNAISMLNSDLKLPYKGSMGFDIASTDFNDYIDMGIYYNGGTNSNFTNIPHAADNGYLLVFKGTRSRQIWIGGFSMAFRTRYMRGNTKDTWSEWTNIIS